MPAHVCHLEGSSKQLCGSLRCQTSRRVFDSHTCLPKFRLPKDPHRTHKDCFYTLIGCCSRLSHLSIKVGLTDSLVLFQGPRFVLFLCCLEKFSGVMANNALFFFFTFLKPYFHLLRFAALYFTFAMHCLPI